MQLLGMFGSHAETLWHPKAIMISALNGQGVDTFWTAVMEFKTLQTANGRLATRRQQQSLAWMWERIEAGLRHAFHDDARVRTELPAVAARVARGELVASVAARDLLAQFLQNRRARLVLSGEHVETLIDPCQSHDG